MTEAECREAIDHVRQCSAAAAVLNVVYLDRARNEPLSPSEVERLVDGLRQALGVPTVGPFAGRRKA